MFAALNSFLTRALTNLTDVYWPFVSMLLHGDGTNAAQNNTFLDGSTNNFTVTRNGNTTQGSFNPFVPTYPYSVATNGGSAYFDGGASAPSLSVPANAAFNLGTSNFTIEYWIYLTTTTALYIASQSDFAINFLAWYQRCAAGVLTSNIRDSSNAQITCTSSAGAIVANTWYHVAFVRDGNTTRQYINGVQNGTGNATGFTVRSSTGPINVGNLYVGSTGDVNGYISNFRLVNGTCLYPSGTTFTPPTAPLTAVTNTALLLGMSNGAIFDNTMLNNLETVSSAQISTSVFKYGTGSVALNGTTDYLNTSPANQNSFAFGSGDFTIEMWVYATSVSGSRVIYDSYPTSTGGFYPSIQMALSGQIFYNTNTDAKISGGTLSTNTWYHIAVCRSGTSTKLFINGTQSGSTYTDSNVYLNSSLRPYIGASGYTGAAFFPGYIDDLRVTKGIARYTTTFTPPTAAFPNLGPTYPSGTATQRAIFAYGYNSNTSAYVTVTNLVSNTGVVAGNTTGVGTSRVQAAGANYGGDKAIIGYGTSSVSNVSLSNLVSNTGAVSTDTTGVGTARYALAASGYGTTGQAIFGFGNSGARTAITNLVSNTGVVATDTAGVGTARMDLAAAKYSTDKAIFAFGSSGAGAVSLNNLVSNTGVVATDTSSAATARQYQPGGASYGVGLAIFGYGMDSSFGLLNSTNLVSNTGVVASDTTGVGTARNYIAASSYGGDKAIFAYGNDATNSVATSNLVSNTGVVATDTTGVGTVRYGPAAAGFSYS